MKKQDLIILLILGLGLGLLIWNALVSWRNNQLSTDIYDFKVEENLQQDKKLQTRADSLLLIIENKNLLILDLSKKLKQKLEKSRKNNKRYEKKKRHAATITDADSLSVIFTRRHQARNH